MTPQPRLVVLDLDGTALVGDDPVRAYLRSLRSRVAMPADVEEALEDHLAHGGPQPDGYAVVAALASQAGASPGQRDAAYAESRAALHAGEVAASAPVGLADALRRRPPDVVVALVTNAPAAGLSALLGRVGLAGCFDRIVGDAGKPARLPAVLQDLMTATGAAPGGLLAVGDIWANDLAAAADLGGTTALVDRHGRGDGSPDLRARTLEALLPALERWWT